jgi:ferredoxin
VKNARLTAGVFLILLFSLFVGGQSAVKTIIVRAKCVGCSDCVRICPVQAITLIRGKAVVDPEKCVGCRLCVVTCSYGAPR